MYAEYGHSVIATTNHEEDAQINKAHALAYMAYAKGHKCIFKGAKASTILKKIPATYRSYARARFRALDGKGLHYLLPKELIERAQAARATALKGEGR